MFAKLKRWIEKLHLEIKGLTKKIEQYIALKKQGDILIKEINEDIILTKYEAIRNQLMNTDKSLLVSIILTLKIHDERDIHCYYENLQNHKQGFLFAFSEFDK